MLVILPFDCVGCFSAWRCILQSGASARANDGDVEQKSLVLESGVAAEKCLRPLLSRAFANGWL